MSLKWCASTGVIMCWINLDAKIVGFNKNVLSFENLEYYARSILEKSLPTSCTQTHYHEDYLNQSKKYLMSLK